MQLAVASAEGFRSLALAADGATDDVAGARCWYSSSSVPVFNGAGIFSQDLLRQDILAEIEAYFNERNRPYSLITVDSLLPNAPEQLAALDYFEYDYMPGMWLDGPPQSWVETPVSRDDLRIARVQTFHDLLTFRTILAQVFHISRLEIELIMGEKAMHIPHVYHYLGWLGGVAVGTTTAVLSGPVAGIWNVGTLTSHRRQGIAARLVCHALAEARQLGYESSMLLASTEGLPLYARLGYNTLSTIRVFVPKRP